MPRWLAALAAVLALTIAIPASAGLPAVGASKPSRTEAPAWARNSVFYGVVVERFGSGTFDAVRHRLGYLDRLGIGAIWLSPINATTPGDFGYAVTDYYRLRRSYGSKHDFRRLVDAAHRRGIKVLMDLVPNHTSDRHPWFRRAQRQGPGSRYWNYYERDAQGRPKHYFDWKNLPNLNYSNAAVRHAVMRFSSYWVREFGVDGYRVDAAWGVRRRAPGFWPRWSRHLRQIDPQAFLLAEASARRPYYLRHGFSGAYDWTGELGQAAWQRVFDRPSRAGDRLASALDATADNAPPGLVFRFLDNNDTGERFVARHGKRLTRVAAAALLTLPGAPLLYSGDEVGARFEPYDLPEPLDFSGHRSLRSYYRRLISLRSRLGVLRGPRERTVLARGPLLAYVRTAGHGKPALVVLNFSRRRRVIDLPSVGATRPFEESDRLRDALGGETVDVTGTPRIAVGPSSARVLVPGG